MDTYLATKADVKDFAVKAFEAHTLTVLRDGLWRCAKRGTSVYAFYVAIMPGAVAIYGDVGEAILRCAEPSEPRVVAWLGNAVRSPDYLLGKFSNRAAYRQFYAGDALRAVEALGDSNFCKAVKTLAEQDDLHEHSWGVAQQEHGVVDFCDARNWAPLALWLVEALAVFVRLLDKES